MAMVAGIPLGRVIGQHSSWQFSFLLIGLCAAAVMGILAKNLPLLPSVNTGSLKSLPGLLKRKNLMLLYALTVLLITAHFTAYSYIEPFVLQAGGFAPEQVTIVLSLYGLAGFAASYLFGKWFGGHTGTMLRNMLAELGIECKVLEVEGETRTNLKIKDPALKKIGRAHV